MRMVSNSSRTWYRRTPSILGSTQAKIVWEWRRILLRMPLLPFKPSLLWATGKRFHHFWVAMGEQRQDSTWSVGSGKRPRLYEPLRQTTLAELGKPFSFVTLSVPRSTTIMFRRYLETTGRKSCLPRTHRSSLVNLSLAMAKRGPRSTTIMFRRYPIVSNVWGTNCLQRIHFGQSQPLKTLMNYP